MFLYPFKLIGLFLFVLSFLRIFFLYLSTSTTCCLGVFIACRFFVVLVCLEQRVMIGDLFTCVKVERGGWMVFEEMWRQDVCNVSEE